MVTDEHGQPFPFATLSILSTVDSTVIVSGMTDDSGRFDIVVADTNIVLRVSTVGYETQVFSRPFPKLITLRPVATELGEAIITAARKYVKMQSNGLSVSMEGNPLSKLSSVFDAIRQMPMIDPSDGTVLGKGSPEIYINKRKVRDQTELRQLSPEKVSSVEIITRPGIRYDSNVRSVIIIHTKKLDEGLAGIITGTGSQAEVASESATVSLSYMIHNGLGFYGGATFDNSGYKQSRTYTERFNEDAFLTETSGKYRSRSKTLKADIGTSFDFTPDKSMGVRYEFSRMPNSQYKAQSNFQTNALANATTAISLSKIQSQNYLHSVNAYSYLTFGKKKNINFSFDADYIYGSNRQASATNETMDDGTEWSVATSNSSAYHIAASKADLNMTFGKVNLDVGAQYSYTKNRLWFQSHVSEGDAFGGSSTDQERQHMYASFLNIAYNLSLNWNVSGGMRIENTAFDYEQNGVKVEEQSKNFTDVLPTISLNYQKENFGLSLSYNTNIDRPSYSMLNNNYTYVSHTSWETGNPLLKSSLTRSIELSLQWKQTILTASYNHYLRAINTVYTYLPEENVNVRQEINLPHFGGYLFTASQSFNAGKWHPMLQGLLLLQNLKYNGTAYNKPIGKITFTNRIDLPWSLYAYLSGVWTSKGNQATLFCEGDLSFYVMLNKTIKNWSFNLLFNDFANTFRQKNTVNTNRVSYREYRKGASRLVQLSVTYSFKQKKSFKGKGSAQEELERF